MANPLRTHHRGFTLTEVMVTLLIFGIVMAVSFPLLSESNRKRQLEGAAARVEAALTHARSTAITDKTPVRVSFDPESNSLEITQDTNEDGIFDGVLRTITLDDDVTFADISFDATTAVIFSQDGTPDHAGSILLANGGSSNQRVLVAATDGKVSVSASAAVREAEPRSKGY